MHEINMHISISCRILKSVWPILSLTTTQKAGWHPSFVVMRFSLVNHILHICIGLIVVNFHLTTFGVFKIPCFWYSHRKIWDITPDFNIFSIDCKSSVSPAYTNTFRSITFWQIKWKRGSPWWWYVFGWTLLHTFPFEYVYWAFINAIVLMMGSIILISDDVPDKGKCLKICFPLKFFKFKSSWFFWILDSNCKIFLIVYQMKKYK